jgi:hypothetical protein
MWMSMFQMVKFCHGSWKMLETEIISNPGAPLAPAAFFSSSQTAVCRIHSGRFLCV